MFFSNDDLLSRIFSDFFRTALFSEKLLLCTSLDKLLRHNSNSFGAAISSEQLLFLSNSVFERVISLQQLFFQNIGSIGSSLGQLLFGTVTFLAEELLRIKIFIEELLCLSEYFCTASAFPEEPHFRKS